MSVAKPYNYWSEARTITTTNGEWAVPGPTVTVVPALRENDDTYVRSKFEARLTYRSANTNSLKTWWNSADVRLVVSMDPQALATPGDVGDNDPLTLAFEQMWPYVDQTSVMTGTYLVEWRTPPGGVIHRTRRDFADAGHRPQILASVFSFDQSGFLGLIAEPTSSIRLQVVGRTLWESSNNGL